MSCTRIPIGFAILSMSVFLAFSPQALAEGELATIKGVVTLDGKPLPFGRVFIHLTEDQFSGSKIREDGTFKVDRLPPGRYKVTMEAKGDKGLNFLPAKYGMQDRSGLLVELKNGTNTLNFDLRSR